MTITSLIDVIFLLLLFFMLATTFARYQRMEIAATATPGAAEATTPPPLVRIAPGPEIDIDGRPVAHAGLADAFAGLKAAGREAVMLLPRRAATVEDLVAILAMVRKAGLAATLVRRPAPAGGS